MYFGKADDFPDAIDKGRVVVLPIVDGEKEQKGLHLPGSTSTYWNQYRWLSEFIPVLKHYARKGYETGVFQRIDSNVINHCLKIDNRICRPKFKPPIKIGISEPASLSANNVQFPFSILATGIIISLGIAMLENLFKRAKRRQKGVRFLF